VTGVQTCALPIFISFLPFAAYSLSLSFYSINDFSVERVINQSEFRAGDALEVEIGIRRRMPFPLFYLLIEEQLPVKLEKQMHSKKKILIFPRFKRRITLEYKIPGLPRGEHELQGIRIKTGDFLGLFEKEAEFSAPKKILVYPAYFDLPFRQLDNLFDQGQAGKANRLQRENSIVSGVREYQHGDQFSWINWKATAKKNDIMTKEFEENKSHDLFLFLDESPSESFEDMVTYTASFVHSIIKKGIQIGFYRSSATDTGALPVRGGELQKQKIFYHLAKSDPAEWVSIQKIIDHNRRNIPSSAALVIMTGSLSFLTIEAIGALKTSQGITIFSVKIDALLSREEIMVREAAQARGISVKYINQGQILSSHSGVMAQ
jgi:uncharacterized protein (DUF58 family)